MIKFEVVQVACPAATGNMDFTGTSPSSDMVGAFFIGSAATADDTNTAQFRLSFGATDLTNNIVGAYGYTNGAASANCLSRVSSTQCLLQESGAGAIAVQAGYGSTLANGVRLTTTVISSGRLVNAVLVSGDAAMKVGAQQFITTDTVKTITHGLGGVPDKIYLITGMGVNGTGTSGPGIALGSWDWQSGNQSSISFFSTAAVNQANITEYVSNSTVAALLGAGVKGADVTISNVGATTFDINVSATGTGNNLIGWIVIRGTLARMVTKNTVTTLPTATGNTQLIGGMATKPQCVFNFPTRMTAVNTVVQSDAAGSMGVGVAATNDYSASTQGASAHTTQSGVATSVTAHQISIAKCLKLLNNTGADSDTATVNSWDVDGMTPNYSAVGASAFQCMVDAMGTGVGGAVASSYQQQMRARRRW